MVILKIVNSVVCLNWTLTCFFHSSPPTGTMIVQGRAIDFKSIIFDESLGVGEYGMVNGGRIMDDENATVFKECTIKMLKGII